MNRTKKIIFYILFGLSLLGIPVFAFGLFNTMVSLKHKTENPSDCISLVTGKDLCFIIQILKAILIAGISTILLLTIFRKRILPLLLPILSIMW